MLVHLKQANLLFLEFNTITAPFLYIKDQLASRTTYDQHGVTVMRLVRKMWKFLTSSNCNEYMGYSVTFMLVALMQTYLFCMVEVTSVM